MLGVGNVTILIAVIADGYSDRLRSILKRKGPRAIVRERVKEWAHSADIGPANTPKAHKHSDFAAEVGLSFSATNIDCRPAHHTSQSSQHSPHYRQARCDAR